jgi:hypothetical protein
MLRVPFEELMRIFKGTTPQIEKLIFVLTQKKLAVLRSNPLFRGTWRSLPLPATPDRTIREPFADCSANVFKQLHAVIMRQRCCVSSTIVFEPVIVPMKEAADVQIGFSCVDQGESNQSVLTLVVHEDAQNLVQEILAQMRADAQPAA